MTHSQGYRPNVVIVICDDLGMLDLGCYGGRLIRTPHLDRFAAGGVRFDKMYSGGPTCTPARAALLTGRVAPRVGAAAPLFPDERGGLLKSERTLAGILAEEGYATACIGKWHLGDMPGNGPREHGFQSYFGMPYSNDMVPLRVFEDRDMVDADPDVSRLTGEYTRRAVRFIEERPAGEPYFLYFAHTMPHQPLCPSAAFRGRSRAGIYGDVVEEIDDSFGAVLATIAARGDVDDTVIMFTSDHGPWFEGAPAPARGRKFETWDGGVLVPCLMSWPGFARPGSVVAGAAASLDFVPTLAARMGLSLPVAFDGADLEPLLSGAAGALDRPIWFFDGAELNAVRVGPWKCHRRRHAWSGEKFAHFCLPQLFDLIADPDEAYDLSDRHPEIVEEMLALMAAMERSLAESLPPRPPAER